MPIIAVVIGASPGLIIGLMTNYIFMIIDLAVLIITILLIYALIRMAKCGNNHGIPGHVPNAHLVEYSGECDNGCGIGINSHGAPGAPKQGVGMPSTLSRP
jgi:hypothetical protein